MPGDQFDDPIQELREQAAKEARQREDERRRSALFPNVELECYNLRNYGTRMGGEASNRGFAEQIAKVLAGVRALGLGDRLNALKVSKDPAWNMALLIYRLCDQGDLDAATVKLDEADALGQSGARAGVTDALMRTMPDALFALPSPLESADDTVASGESGGARDKAGTGNPLHQLCDWLQSYRTAVANAHEATTADGRNQTLDAWRALPKPQRPEYSDNWQRGLADPVLAWLRQHGLTNQEHVATVERAAGLVVLLARKSPIAYPSVYANESDAWPRWEQQKELLLRAMHALNELQRMAALSGAIWPQGGAASGGAADPAHPTRERELPTGKVPGVVSLNVLKARMNHPDIGLRRSVDLWPETPKLRLACARLLPGQPWAEGTIELLIAWFQERGLSAEQARHLPLAEAVRRLAEAQLELVGAACHRSVAGQGEGDDDQLAKGRTMPDSLQAYYAELHAAEDEWYDRHRGEGWVIGTSPWDSHLDRLREIDARHGIQPDDPRVYSITAYRRERQAIEDDFRRLCRENGWTDPDQDKPYFRDYWQADIRHSIRLSDCRARHFPGLDSLREYTIDTLPKLWAHIRLCLLVVGELTSRRDPSQPRPALPPADVQQTYALLHRLKVAWAPTPPYASFTEGEARDELERIANRLEEEDRRRCSAHAEATAAARNQGGAWQGIRQPEARTLEWLISTLQWYEELRAKQAASPRSLAAFSAEARSRKETDRDLWRVSGDLRNAPGVGRIETLCNELHGSNELTAANVLRLRSKVCRAKPCSPEEANSLTLDEVADLLEPGILPGQGAVGQGEGTGEAWTWAPDGNGYLVAGLGERGHFARFKGLAMIEKLVRAPGQPVPMVVLVGGGTEQPGIDKRSKQPAMDMESLQATYEQMSVLRAEAEQAESEGRTVEAAECREELDRLQARLKHALGIKGKVRDLNDLANKLRPTIHAALARVFKAMRAANPPLRELANHLESAISSESAAFVYRPALTPYPSWETSIADQK